MESKMKNLIRRQIFTLMLGAAAFAVSAPAANVAFAEESHSGVSDSDSGSEATANASSDDSADGTAEAANDDGANHDANEAVETASDDGPNHDANDDTKSDGDDPLTKALNKLLK
jgi:long-subunit fatty acid transport protein